MFKRILLLACGILSLETIMAPTAKACDPGNPATCDDGNLCTDHICDPVMGCLHASNSAACEDGNQCTTGDVCSGGVCVGGNTANGCAPCQAVAVLYVRGRTSLDTAPKGRVPTRDERGNIVTPL
jgi:hypothetical protein